MNNNAGFFSLNKKSDWAKGWTENLQFSDAGMWLESDLKYAVSRVFRLKTIIPAETDITDIAVESSGVFYALDSGGILWKSDIKNEQSEVFIKPGHGLFTGGARLALLKGIVLTAEAGAGRALTAFSTANAQVLWELNDFNGGAGLYPLAVTARRDCFYVVAPLETSGGVDGLRPGTLLGILKINRYGRVLNVFRHESFRLTAKTDKGLRPENFFMAAAGNGSVYVLDAESRTIYGFTESGELSRRFSPDISAALSGIFIDAENNIYIGDCKDAGHGAEDGRFIHKFSGAGEYIETVSGFRGSADKLQGDEKNVLYVWNAQESMLSVLELRQRISGLQRGTFISAALDGTVSEMQWHKLVLEVEVPENTQIRISYYCSEKLKEVDRTGPYWSEPAVNPTEALLPNARGRYLWLKIDFIGSLEKTPLLKKIRIYYPRVSYLDYLPAVYQKDPRSADFLERYLALFESFFTEMEEKISGIARYYDPEAVSGPFLFWLAGWLGIAKDDSWSEDQLRSLMKRAPALYKMRGTRQAIEEIIEIYTGSKPYIVEYFQFKHMKDDPEMKGILSDLYKMDPYCFTVLVKQECVADDQRLMAVQKILDREKPAFTEARLVILQPWMYMNMHTYLGINTYLSELTLLRLDQKSTVPNNTVLTDVNLDNRLSVHTRVEIDAEVKY